MPQTYYLGNSSLFITLTAWFSLVVSALACAFGVVQQASVAAWQPGMEVLVQAEPLPALSHWLLSYLPWATGAGLLVSVALLVASVGLLMRMEWARRAFIGLLVLAIGANLAGLWLQHEFLHSLAGSTLSRAPWSLAMARVFGASVAAAQLLGGLMTAAACVLLGWVIRRMMSPWVRQEFTG